MLQLVLLSLLLDAAAGPVDALAIVATFGTVVAVVLVAAVVAVPTISLLLSSNECEK